jgi:hypothetical protein
MKHSNHLTEGKVLIDRSLSHLPANRTTGLARELIGQSAAEGIDRHGKVSHTRHQHASLHERIYRRLKRTYQQCKKSGKTLIARTIYSLPLMSQYNPRRKLIKFKDHCSETKEFPVTRESASEDWYLRVRSPETIYRNAPISLSESEAAKFRASTLTYQNGDQFEIPEVFLACVNQAKIQSCDFFALSPSNRVFYESALSRDEVLEENGILDTLIWPSPHYLRGTYCLLAHPWTDAYYHWVIEILPRLSIVEQYDELQSIPLIVPKHLKTFQQESLQLAEISSDRIAGFNGGCWQVDKLFFPELLSPTGCPSPHAIAWLRARFLKNDAPRVGARKRSIYVTRRDASTRRVLNEDAIISYLQTRDFEIVCPGELSFSQQIDLFRDVDIVVAAHGAAATNMAFAPPNATLIELFGDNYINGCFWALANICRQHYAFLTGPSDWLDYSIPLDQLKILLDKVKCEGS